MTDERHAYQRIADDLRKQIDDGHLAHGDRLPSIPALTRSYGVSSKTAAEALKVLISEGVAMARSGSGTFVQLRPDLTRLIRSWYRATPYEGSPESQREGRQTIRTYHSKAEIAPDAIRKRLALGDPGPEPDVVGTEYLLLMDDAPALLETSWEPLALTRGKPIVLPQDGMLMGRGVTERMLSIGVVVDDWVEEIGSRLGTAEECSRLAHAPGSIMMTIQRTYFAGELRVETADIVVPADRFSLVYSGRMGAV